MTDPCYWVGLSLVPEVGPVISRRLLASLGSPENVFRAGIQDLTAVQGLTREKALSIRDFSLWDTVKKQVAEAERKGIAVVGYLDPCYPEPLREIDGAPIVLYMKGEYQAEDRYGIAVVGSRKYSDYGETVTRTLSGELASAGFTIISGMARGIDTISHTSALAAGGRTLAVLGTGLDVPYPFENRGLMERIISSGCAISEFPPGTLPARENFPRRNRLISGLGLGVLVVEAARESGSLITARYALEQNKEVFAVPGKITSLNSGGTNRLIKEGAKLVTETDDIISELAPVLKGFLRQRAAELPPLSMEEKAICNLLTREPQHIDLLSRDSGVPVQRLLELTLSLELKGVVRQAGGKRFYLS